MNHWFNVLLRENAFQSDSCATENQIVKIEVMKVMIIVVSIEMHTLIVT